MDQPAEDALPLNISGILVVVAPGHLDAVCASVATLQGIEVSQVDAASGRIVIVQEASDVASEVAGFARIRALPGVLCADLICHYFGDQPATASDTQSALTQLSTLSAAASRAEARDVAPEPAPTHARNET